MTAGSHGTILRLLVFTFAEDSDKQDKQAKLILDKALSGEPLKGKPEAILAMVQAMARCSESTECGDENDFRLVILGSGTSPQTSILYKRTATIIAIIILSYPFQLRRHVEFFLNNLVLEPVSNITDERVDELLKGFLPQR